MSDTLRTEAEIDRPRGPLDDIVTVDANFAAQLERELNAANERIESLNRGNANAERILCELTGCESGRDVPDWIVKKNWEFTDLTKAYLELVHKHTLAEERIKRLEEALSLIRPTCECVHHSKKHRHSLSEPCPVVALIEKAKETKP